ncbi:MAG TPA: CpsD/CapB family tyrosine-protein kinase [Silvibacterium sp.]|nr:CpsD/CapB family tyrosine-protein kinase [Silvibacterium sp.]
MESLFQTATASRTAPDTGSQAGLSNVTKPWAREGARHDIAHTDRLGGIEFPKMERGFGRTPPNELDSRHIRSEVILAQRLSNHQEKNLHFIIQRYRLLCNRVVEVAQNLNSQVFLITSALADEGKTLTSANLAFALAGIERKRTLLIDLDLRRHSLHSVLGVQPSKSEVSFLRADDWRDCLWSLRPNLHALLATRPADHPNELLQGIAIHNLLAEARQEYDYILIDSAPLLLAADTHALLPAIDQALLVVRADFTPIACSQDALKILGGKAVGCILNDVKHMKYESYYHGYYGTDEK